MLQKLIDAFGAGGSARASSPPGTTLVPVPIHRAGHPPAQGETRMGYLDRNPDSARQQIGMAPVLRTADQEIRRSWTPVTAQTRHLLTQSGFLSYGVELTCAWTVGGDGLGVNVSPDADKLGWQPSFAKTWANAVEAAFREWSHDQRVCDGQGRLKFGAMQSAALRSYLATGDIIATLEFKRRPGSRWASSLSLIDPARLWTPPVYAMPNVRITDGVEFDESGRSVAYHFRPLQGFGTSIRVPVHQNGKQVVLHAFDGEVGAIRGISPLASAIQAIAQSQNVQDAATLAAHVAAMIVGVVTSDLPSDAVARSLGGPDANALEAIMANRVEWHEQLKKANAHLQLGHGARIAHLSTGERFDLFAGKVTFDEYEKIIRLGLAEAARALGLSPEHMTGLKDQATYSSLKVAAAEVRAIIDRRRKVLVEPLCEFALASVVEEMIGDGRLPFPSRGYSSKLEAFRAQRALALKCEWTGPAVEDPDVLKSTRAAVERVEAGLSSLSDEIAASGKDPETVMRRRADDEAALRDLGVEMPWTSSSQQRKGVPQ